MLSRLLAPARPVAIAHRGGSKLRPENTMLAFEHALALGVDAIECDVRLSRDREPMVIHDETLDRTTDARGLVSAMTAAELAGVDAGCRFERDGHTPYRAQGIGIPPLSAVLAATGAIPVIVEIKGDDPAAVDAVLAVVAAARAEARVIIGGFSHRVLSAIRQRAPALATSASQEEVQNALRRAYVLLAPRRTGYRLFQVPVRFRGRHVLRRSFVRALLRAGVPVQAWIVDEVDEMRLLVSWGVSGLISDRPDRAVEIVREYPVRSAVQHLGSR